MRGPDNEGTKVKHVESFHVHSQVGDDNICPLATQSIRKKLVFFQCFFP